MITNEDFLKSLAEDYPNQDWDNLPDLDSAPVVFYIKHKVKWTDKRDVERIDGCESQKEYATKDEVLLGIEEMKKNPSYHTVQSRPVEFLWDTVEICERKPHDLVCLHLMHDLRADVLAGEEVFPMHLP